MHEHSGTAGCREPNVRCCMRPASCETRANNKILVQHRPPTKVRPSSDRASPTQGLTRLFTAWVCILKGPRKKSWIGGEEEDQ